VSSDSSAIELGQRLAETLSRFGIAGHVVVEGRTAILTGNGPTVSSDVGAVLDQWPNLPEDARQRRLAEIARKLAADRRARVGSGGASHGFSSRAFIARISALAGAFVLLCLGWMAYERWEASKAAERAGKPVVADYDEYERQRAERAARVCDATRSRVMRGASVGPSDVEGWVVEYWALRDPAKPVLTTDPALQTFIAPVPGDAHHRVAWATAPTLSSLEGPDTTVTPIDDDVPASGPATWRGLRLVLTGRYVTPYFDETLRQEYQHLARALTDALGAEYAGLYARCAAGDSHLLGSWFRGPTPGGAVASLLFFMGTFGPHPDVRQSLLAPEGASFVDRGLAFRNVASAASPLKKARIMTLLGAENGAISGKDDQLSTVTFPFRDANRASRASREIARQLGIADER